MSNTMNPAESDFGRKAVRTLARKGIRLIGSTVIPGVGPMPYANGERGYQIDDNGTGRIWTYAQVKAAIA